MMQDLESRIPPGTLKLALLNTLCFVSFAVITPVLDILIRQPFGLGSGGTARFMAVHGVAMLICGAGAGLWSDKLGRRVPLIVIGLIGSGVTTALIPHVHHFPTLLLVRFLDGCFGAFSLGLIITRALDLAGKENRNRTMGVMSIAISAGFIIAPILTGLLAHRSLPILFGLVGALLVLGGLWMIADLPQAESFTAFRGNLRQVVHTFRVRPRLALPIVFAFVDKFTFGTLAHLTALAVKDLHGKETIASSLILLGFWVAFAPSCLLASRLCDRFGSLATLLAGSAIYGACLMGLGTFNFTGFFGMMTLAGGFCAIQYVPSMALVGEIADPSQRGISMGVWNTAGSIGIVAGIVVSGKLSSTSYALAYGVTGGLEIVCVLLTLAVIFALGRRKP